MANKAEIPRFLELAESLPLVDVRSPLEYDKGHIPGAVSIPLFDNDERAKVGITYHKEGSEMAVKKGYETANPRKNKLVEAAFNLNKGHKLLVYCWRGGMRSATMAELFEENGFTCILADGGYQAFRRHIHRQLAVKAKIIMLGGKTGSGKTELLHLLNTAGQQVIDLEKLANHKGSVFGNIGCDDQPTNEQFINELFHEWRKLDLDSPVWIEDESISLGKIFIPDALWNQMKTSPVINIDRPADARINFLTINYSGIADNLLLEGISRLSKRTGIKNAQDARQALIEHNYNKTAGLLLQYYDKAYQHSLKKRKGITVLTVQTTGLNDDEIVKELIKKACGLYPQADNIQ